MLDKYPDLLTVKETAEVLRVSKAVIYNMIKEGTLKVYKFGREYKCPKLWLIENYLTNL